MTYLRSTESAYSVIEPRAGADDFERERAVVTARVMLEVLITLKMDLAKSAPAEIAGAGEFEVRINRVEAAISDLQRVVRLADITDDTSATSGCRAETTLALAPISER